MNIYSFSYANVYVFFILILCIVALYIRNRLLKANLQIRKQINLYSMSFMIQWTSKIFLFAIYSWIPNKPGS